MSASAQRIQAPTVHKSAGSDRPSAPARPVASVVVPAFNERRGLPFVLERLDALRGDGYEILVVDDGSTDGTADAARDFGATVIRHETNLGKGRAVRTALEFAASDRVVVIDADNTYPVEAIPSVIEMLDRHDLVVGRRRFGRRNIALLNRLGNWGFQAMIRLVSGSRLTDPLSGLYAARRSAFRRMRLAADGFGIEAEIAVKSARLGLDTAELPVRYDARIGESKLHPFKDGLRIAMTVLSHARFREEAPNQRTAATVAIAIADRAVHDGSTHRQRYQRERP